MKESRAMKMRRDIGFHALWLLSKSWFRSHVLERARNIAVAQ